MGALPPHVRGWGARPVGTGAGPRRSPGRPAGDAARGAGRDRGGAREDGRGRSAKADPGERGGAPRRVTGRRAAHGDVRARGHAPDRRLTVTPPRGAGPPRRRAITGLRAGPLHVRPGPPAAERPAAPDPRGGGDPGGAPVLGRHSRRGRGGRPRGACAPARGPVGPARRRARGDRSRRGRSRVTGAGLRHQRAPAARRIERWTRSPGASRRPPTRRSGTGRR